MDQMDGLIENLQKIKQEYQLREKELILKHQREKILWEDEKHYLEKEIKTVETQYKNVIVEKGKYHKLYLSAKAGVVVKNDVKTSVNKDTPDKNAIISDITTPNTDIVEPSTTTTMNNSSVTEETNAKKKQNKNVKRNNKLLPTTLNITSSLEDNVEKTPTPTTIRIASKNAETSTSPLNGNVRNKAASPSQVNFNNNNNNNNSKEDDSSIIIVDTSGWLLVKMDDYPYPISRWVSVKENGMLLLYVDSFADTPIHGFILRNYNVTDVSKNNNNENENQPFSFTLENETKTMKYSFYCNDVNELNKWIDVLKMVCKANHQQTELFQLKANVLKQCKSGTNMKNDLMKVFKMMDERQEIIIAGAMKTTSNNHLAEETEKQTEKITTRKPLQAIECKLKLQHISNNVQRLRQMKENVLKMKKAIIVVKK